MGLGCHEVCLEAFSAWLVEHEQDVVGYRGRCFDSPLARWLSALAGHLYGVDEGRYGRAVWEDCYWRPLPRWAHLFSAFLDAPVPATVTGRQAFGVLAQVELVLTWRGCSVRREEE